MKKYLGLISALALFGAILTFGLSTSDKAFAASGKSIFKSNGCMACHYTKKGMTKKPYPTMQHMANRSYAEYTDCIKKGVPGTAMTAKGMSDADIKATYDWLQKYK